MANAAQKITLSPSRDIPFNKLVLSQSNVRRIKAGVSIEELAEDIARRGLLQSLSVRPVVDADGAETGMFEIPAGGRRYRALELLVKQKRLAKTAPVPCVVRERRHPPRRIRSPKTSSAHRCILSTSSAPSSSAREGPVRGGDRRRLLRLGQCREAAAALASVSPKLLDVYAEDGMTLEAAHGLHGLRRSCAPGAGLGDGCSTPTTSSPIIIRPHADRERGARLGQAGAVHWRRRYIEAAGGMVLRDLFEGDDGGWLQDVALLDRLWPRSCSGSRDDPRRRLEVDRGRP